MPALYKYILDDVIETKLRFYDTQPNLPNVVGVILFKQFDQCYCSISFDKQYLNLITENNYVRKRNRVEQNCKLETKYFINILVCLQI